jgi:hypothetical protein
VFDANSRAVLRQLKGHARPAHVARWSPDKTHVLSGGDDVTVRWWDISSGSQVTRCDGHTDYVRAAAVSPASEATWLTGEAQWRFQDSCGSPDMAHYPDGFSAVVLTSRRDAGIGQGIGPKVQLSMDAPYNAVYGWLCCCSACMTFPC